MKYNEYNTRRQQRYQATQTPPIGKKLMEQFITQMVVCVLLVGAIVGAQFLGYKQIDPAINKIKMAIVYSPSLDEMAQKAKDTLAIMMERVNLKDENEDKDKEEETIPVISIDNDVL